MSQSKLQTNKKSLQEVRIDIKNGGKVISQIWALYKWQTLIICIVCSQVITAVWHEELHQHTLHWWQNGTCWCWRYYTLFNCCI